MVAPADRRAVLRRSFLQLGLGELAAVGVFVYVALVVVVPRLSSDRAAASFLVATGALVLVLGQAGAYWLLARSWVEVGPMPRYLAGIYRTLRVVDVLTLLMAGLYIAVGLPATGWASNAAVLVWLFAMVEFANYYVVRLSYPWAGWFSMVGQRRTPRLVQDLRAASLGAHVAQA